MSLPDSTSTGGLERADARLELEDVALRFPDVIEHSLKGAVLNLFRRQPRARGHGDTLSEINLSLSPGDRLGVVGANGAGKTTLLQVMAGIYRPSRGRAQHSGTLVPILQLGLGFNPELTGRQNILFAGSVLAIPRRVMQQRVPRILEFCELEDYADTPLKYYSTGMTARLGFAVATEVDPSILLLDEVFAVGDLRWVERAVVRMEELVKRVAILVVVSHSLDIIERLCNRCIYIDKGRIVADGPVTEVIDGYRQAAGAGS